MTPWLYLVVCTSHYLIIIIMQTYLKVSNIYNTCEVHSVSSLHLRWSQISQLPAMQYMGLCVLNLPISFMIIVRIRILDLIIIIKSEVWSICHCLWLGHETMVCAVCDNQLDDNRKTHEINFVIPRNVLGTICQKVITICVCVVSQSTDAPQPTKAKGLWKLSIFFLCLALRKTCKKWSNIWLAVNIDFLVSREVIRQMIFTCDCVNLIEIKCLQHTPAGVGLP